MQKVNGITLEDFKKKVKEVLLEVKGIVVEEVREFLRRLSIRVVETFTIELDDLLGKLNNEKTAF